MTRLFEGLEQGDLKRLVHSELHIDEFKSKLGDDQDVVVISFKVAGKEPAQDLVNFIEKGYDWVIDADVSSGEMDDGDYIVFIEGDRDEKIAERVVEMMSDVMNTTEQKTEEWRVRYHTSQEDHELSLDSLRNLIPSNPEAYRQKFPEKDEEESEDDNKEHSDKLDKLKSAAGVKVSTKAPKNEFTESLRIAAGIR
jgi:translation initiation factor IF-2